MKKMLFLAVILLSAVAASAQVETDSKDKTLYILNGKVVSADEFNSVPAEQVTDTQIIKGVKRVMVMTTDQQPNLDDVVIVNGTNASVKVYQRTDGNTQSKTVRVVRGDVRGELQSENGENEEVQFMLLDEKPLCIQVDGENNLTVVKDMSTINTSDIEFITVLKNEETKSFEQYGDVSNGVILIRLK